MPINKKAKRKLSDIDFSSEGSHMALVSKEQGGPANKADYALVIKSTNKFSEEMIEKMQQIRVTMELPEFLCKFFDMYYDDAELLAAMMGYEKPEDLEEMYDYDSWIESRLESFEILKSLYESDNRDELLEKLSPEDHMSLLQDQEKLEKAFNKKKGYKKSKGAKPEESSTEVSSEVGSDKVTKTVTRPVKVVSYDELNKGGWEPTDNLTQVNKEESMSKKTDTAEVEVVEKSIVDIMKSEMEAKQVELQKALESQKEELQKAQELIENFKKEQKEAKDALRKQALKAAVKQDDKIEVLFKAANLLESDEDFNAVVKALEGISKAVEESEAFKEVGANGEGSAAPENKLAALIKSKNKSK